MLPLRSFGVPPTASNELMMWIKPWQQTATVQRSKMWSQGVSPAREATLLALCTFALIQRLKNLIMSSLSLRTQYWTQTPGHPRPEGPASRNPKQNHHGSEAAHHQPGHMVVTVQLLLLRPRTSWLECWTWRNDCGSMRTFPVLAVPDAHGIYFNSLGRLCLLESDHKKKSTIQPGSRAQQAHCEPRGTKHCWHSDVVCPWHVGNRLTLTVDIHRSNQTWVNRTHLHT